MGSGLRCWSAELLEAEQEPGERTTADAEVVDLLLAFFAKHLNQAAAPLLEGPSGDYPELSSGSP